jgi:hypothetical protein
MARKIHSKQELENNECNFCSRLIKIKNNMYKTGWICINCGGSRPCVCDICRCVNTELYEKYLNEYKYLIELCLSKQKDEQGKENVYKNIRMNPEEYIYRQNRMLKKELSLDEYIKLQNTFYRS